ncbi:MAG: ABC transporter permease subunit [Candidatus Limnocylindria bacterium]
MLRTIATKVLRDSWRGLLFWNLGIAALAFLTVGSYPAIRDNPELNQFMESLPEAVLALIGESDLVSPAGYLNSQLFGSIVPLLFLFYAVGAGAAAIAGEEETGTLDLLLANPVSRTRVLLEKAAAMLLGLVIIGFSLWVVTMAGALLVDMEIGAGRLAEVIVSAILFGFLMGSLALAVGASAGSRGLSIGIAAAVGIAAYLVQSLAALVEFLEPVARISPFYFYYEADPLRNGIDPLHAGVLAGTSLVLVVLALIGFNRRDLRV